MTFSRRRLQLRSFFRLVTIVLLLASISGSIVHAQRIVDTDGDGVPDSQDKCPRQSGPASNNGCPLPDGDGDGIPDNQDQCPKDHGIASLGGCPGSDRDGDGTRDENDQCPDAGGPDWNNGCPTDTTIQPEANPAPTDSDGDGVPDPQDQCPTVPGSAATGGCTLPELPKDGDCVLATKGIQRVNVRHWPAADSDIVGRIVFENIYPVLSEIQTDDDFYYFLGDGWVAGHVVRTGGDCQEKPPQIACVSPTAPEGAANDGEQPCKSDASTPPTLICSGGTDAFVPDFNGDGKADKVESGQAGETPFVKISDGISGNLLFNFLAFDAGFTGGVHVAVGDVNGDGTVDIIAVAGAGGGPHVKVFDGKTLALLASFFAFDASFTGGVHVAVGDVNGDGAVDIVAAVGADGGPHVKVFDGKTLALIASFFAYAPTFTGGVRVAVGDVNGDCAADIITGTGPGGGPHVKVFDGKSQALLGSFFALAPSFTGGIDVSIGDVNGDGKNDIIVSGGAVRKAFDGKTFAEISGTF